MNLHGKIALLAALLLAVTLPFKLLLANAYVGAENYVALADDMARKTTRIREFLDLAGIHVIGELKIKPTIDNWYGWRVDTGDCTVNLIPDSPRNEGAAQVLTADDQNGAIRYVYRGVISDEPPTLRINFDILRDRLLWPFPSPSFHSPLVVLIVAPPGCTGFRAWPWANLWQSMSRS